MNFSEKVMLYKVVPRKILNNFVKHHFFRKIHLGGKKLIFSKNWRPEIQHYNFRYEFRHANFRHFCVNKHI